MSDTDTNWTEYFLNSNSSIVQLEGLEISHPNFTQTYYVCRNCSRAGITLTHEDSTSHAYIYYPLKIKAAVADETLECKLQITMGDLGEILPKEFDAVFAANGFGTKPTVKYRTWRSDDLTTPLYGPLTLQITTFSSQADATQFDAGAPSLNINLTGEEYTIDRFPMLRGFL